MNRSCVLKNFCARRMGDTMSPSTTTGFVPIGSDDRADLPTLRKRSGAAAVHHSVSHKIDRSTNLWCYFLKNASREARQRWPNFCLGSFTCLIVVCVSAVCFTVLERAPIVFLQEAETKFSQIDLRIQANSKLNENGRLVNYTAVAEIIKQTGDSSMTHHSPRASFPVTVFGNDCVESVSLNVTDMQSSSWMYEGPVPGAEDGCPDGHMDCISKLCKPTG
jgi:hypothetical protein